MSGYIKLYRGWANCELLADEKHTEREAWLWLIENCAWKPITRASGGGAINLERGQISVSLASLSSTWGWSIKRVRTFLNKLEMGHMVGLKRGTARGTAGTILTVCNYDKYQGEVEDEGTVKGTVGARSGHTQEELKERKKENIARLADRPECVSAEVWADFTALRRAKRAPLTETALAVIEREAVKAQWTLEAALTESITRGWQSFKAEWVKGTGDDLMANFLV